jgi:hypothetical protein
MELEDTQPHERRPRRFKIWMLGLVLLGGLWLRGLVSFVAADGHFELTLPRLRNPPAGLHNLSLWDLGPTIRASSFYGDWGSHHHPAFLVDGRVHPDQVEKWASAEHDRHPWVEISWREKHDLERVVIRHAGSVEATDLTAHRYTLHCLDDGGQAPSLEVTSNEDSVATHQLVCTQVRGIRIDFVPKDSKDIIRIYEVETWGR